MTNLVLHSDEVSLEAEEGRILATFSRRLIEIAALSRSGIKDANATDTLNVLRQPALLMDAAGFVIQGNGALEEILDTEIRVRDRRLFIRDIDARNSLQSFLDRLNSMPVNGALPAIEPIVVPRRDKLPIILRIWPIAQTGRWPSPDARALLTLNALGPKPGPPATILARAFRLTPSEAKLASIIARGAAPDTAARELNISRETVRNQLKSIFAKTGTHRQGELVALLLQVD
jgi:DNA-binding CsgD family transcriptional regulator